MPIVIFWIFCMKYLYSTWSRARLSLLWAITEDKNAQKLGKTRFRKYGKSEIKWPITPLYSNETPNEIHIGQFYIHPYHHVKFELNQFTTQYSPSWFSLLCSLKGGNGNVIRKATRDDIMIAVIKHFLCACVGGGGLSCICFTMHKKGSMESIL